jgi:uncharacterized protein YgbK (DUF1537 family)
MSISILADDLTGAADSAARCRNAGLSASILLRAKQSSSSAVQALSSDSRWLGPAQAAQSVRDTLAHYPAPANTHWYKKIDSTLRGNLGSELDAMLTSLTRRHAIISPAFPAQGRGLEQGRLCSPSSQNGTDLLALLRAQSQARVAHITLAHVRTGSAALAQTLQQQSQHAELLVVDALSENDLETLVQAAQQALPTALLCGSAGLIGALARSLEQQPAANSTPAPIVGPALIVVGSASSMAQQQIAHLAAIQRVQVQPDAHHQTQQNARDLLLHLPPAATTAQLDGPHARALAKQLAQAAYQQFCAQRPALLVLVGGDTTAAVLEALQVEHLEIVRELLPGMPLCRANSPHGMLALVLKAGSHGQADSLAQLLVAARRKTN